MSEEKPDAADQLADTPRKFSEIRALKKRKRKSVDIVMDGTLASRIEQLRQDITAQRMEDRRHNAPDKAPKMEEELRELLEEAQESTVTFWFESIGRHRFDKLIADNPPTKEQAKEQMGFNLETFPPKLVAHCSVDPKITVKEAEEMFTDPDSDWNSGELERLFACAMEVNSQAGDLPLSKAGIERILDSG